MRRLLAISATALLALCVPVLAPAQQPRGGQLSIQASPSTVTFGQVTTISGRLKGRDNEGVAMALKENPHPYTTGFTEIAAMVTNARGEYSFRVRIRVSIRLSDSTPRRGALVRFSGSAAPEHDGRIARIQRRTSTGDYRTVARTWLRDAGDERSAYSRRLRVRRDGVYRVLVPADGDHATGTSRARSIRVH